MLRIPTVILTYAAIIGGWGILSFSAFYKSESQGQKCIIIRVGVIKIVINCNLITFSKVIECNCN